MYPVQDPFAFTRCSPKDAVIKIEKERAREREKVGEGGEEATFIKANTVAVYRGTSPRRKRPPPWDPPRTPGIGLR